ncbi:hypothetical protein ACLKA6_012143 [Drosophila palustris]
MSEYSDVMEVLGLDKKDDKITYLMRQSNQNIVIMPSHDARQIFFNEIIEFYEKRCFLKEDKMHVPIQYKIGAEQTEE